MCDFFSITILLVMEMIDSVAAYHRTFVQKLKCVQQSSKTPNRCNLRMNCEECSNTKINLTVKSI